MGWREFFPEAHSALPAHAGTATLEQVRASAPAKVLQSCFECVRAVFRHQIGLQPK